MCVAVTYLIQPGQEEKAIELFAALTQQTHAEAGNLYYLVHRSPTEPRRFFLYEQYTDQAALDVISPRFMVSEKAQIVCSQASKIPKSTNYR